MNNISKEEKICLEKAAKNLVKLKNLSYDVTIDSSKVDEEFFQKKLPLLSPPLPRFSYNLRSQSRKHHVNSLCDDQC